MKSSKAISGLLLVGLVVLLAGHVSGPPPPVRADGFVTFENGTDGQVIESTIPGLAFTTTDGYDWVYGDWRTGNYNGKYPNGIYTSNGNFFAWLGPNQGDGRIDFTAGGATYLSVWISALVPVTMNAYYADGRLAATAMLLLPNVGTGKLDNLRVEAPTSDPFHYVIISGVANFWLIDDLSTDAGGVPVMRNPLVFIPGVMGSRLNNDPNLDGKYSEVWPNSAKLALSPGDGHLRVLKLDADGVRPYKPDDPAYSTVAVGDIVRKEIIDIYESTVNYFTGNGYVEGKDFIVCPYDWRKDIREIAAGSLNETLDKCIEEALAKNSEATKVNILAHSMGGVVSRYYVSDPVRAQKVQRLVTLGTPYLGAPQTALGIIDGICPIEPFEVCLSNPKTINELLQNFSSAYQIAPSSAYFQVYPRGYIRRDWDADGNGAWDGYLNETTCTDMLKSHNADLAQDAIAFQQSIAGWSDGGTNGVEVAVIVGDQIGGATGTIIEYQKCPWWNPWGKCTVNYRARPTNGDGTVPLRSADMRNLARGVDLTNGVPVFYYRLEHGDLAKDYLVLQLAGDIFESPGSLSAGQLYAADAQSESRDVAVLDPQGILRDASRVSPASTPRTSPLPLTGRFLSIDGPAEVEVFDSVGNRLGKVDDVGDVENLIPEATYRVIGPTRFIFLPADSNYTLKVYGLQEASTDIRVEKIVQDQLVQTDVYDDLPITGNSIATLYYDPNAGTAGSFYLDQDGNGVNEAVFPPSATLDAVASQDIESPQTAIALQGTQTPDGWYTGPVTATLTAQDNAGGTGVAKLEYSLDGGGTVSNYTAPFVFEAEMVQVLLAKATDRAGNEEAPLAYARIRPEVLYLPAVLRQ